MHPSLSALVHHKNSEKDGNSEAKASIGKVETKDRPDSALTSSGKDETASISTNPETKGRPVSAASCQDVQTEILVPTGSGHQENQRPFLELSDKKDPNEKKVSEEKVASSEGELSIPVAKECTYNVKEKTKEEKDTRDHLENNPRTLRPKTAAFLRKDTASDSFDDSDEDFDDKQEIKKEVMEAEDKAKSILPRIKKSFDLYDNEARGFVPTSSIGNIMRSSGFD